MKILLPLFCLLILVSCSNEVPPDKLVERGGITYEINSTTPFTGQSVKYSNLVVVEEIRERISYKNGKRDGLHESFYKNGQFKFGRNYKDGELDGLWEEYYENGQIKTRGNYKNDKMDGVQEWFNKNGQLLQKTNYTNGEMNGLHETYHENGQLRSEGHYLYGTTGSPPFQTSPESMRVGVYKEYSKNGELIKHIDYSFNSDYPVLVKEKDGEFRTQGWGVGDQNYDENTKTGLREGFNSQGQLVRKVHFDKGKPGLHEFYKEGKLTETGQLNLESRTMEGVWEYFDERGKLTQRVNYKDGELDGLSELFHENGQLRSRGDFKKGRKVGETIFSYHENGQLRSRGEFKKGRKEGETRFSYHENGQLNDITLYKEGKKDGFQEVYKEDGTVLSKTCFHKDLLTSWVYCEKKTR